MAAHESHYGLSAVTIAPFFEGEYGSDVTKYCLNIQPAPSSNVQTIKGINILIQGADNHSDAIFIHGTGDINGVNCAVSRGTAISGRGESNEPTDAPIGGYFETNQDSHYALKTGTGLVYFQGNVGIGQPIPSEKLDVYGNIQTSQRLIIASGNAPASSKGASGDKVGMIAWGDMSGTKYLFLCVSDYTTGTVDIWQRVALPGGTW